MAINNIGMREDNKIKVIDYVKTLIKDDMEKTELLPLLIPLLNKIELVLSEIQKEKE